MARSSELPPRRRVRCHLRELREAAGLSQPELATAAGVSNAAVSHWETGERVMGAVVALRIARVLGVSVEDLYR